jgi:hypothetical protein
MNTDKKDKYQLKMKMLDDSTRNLKGYRASDWYSKNKRTRGAWKIKNTFGCFHLPSTSIDDKDCNADNGNVDGIL